MKPILFPADETTFQTNGLGRLSDAISCMVTEERNGQYELHMVYPQTGIHFEEITNGRLIYAVPADGKSPQPFRIYRISKPLSGKVEIDAEHISYQMSHIPVMPFSANTTFIQYVLPRIMEHVAESNPFTLRYSGELYYTSQIFKVTEPDNLRALLFGQQGSLLDLFGGEWEFDMYDATLHRSRGSDKGVTIRYGKNLTDIKQEENIQTTYTGICPYWKGTEEGTSTEEVVTLPEMVIHSESAANYPYQRTKVVDLSSSFDTKPTVEQLRTRANRYITENDVGKPKVSLSVSFVALHQTQEYADLTMIEHINLCDTVTVDFPELGVSTKAKVIKTVYDVLLDRYDSIDIGEAVSNLNGSMEATAEDVAQAAVQVAKGESDDSYATKAQLAEALNTIAAIAAKYAGANGGYIVINADNNNQTTELLILCDSKAVNSAQQVFRWNNTGLSYSGTGYSGTYTSLIDANGKVNIAALSAGTLADSANKNSWNMTTGAMALSSDVTFGGSTLAQIIANAASVSASDVITALTQAQVLGKLTGDGADTGLTLVNGSLTFAASRLSGVISDLYGNSWNLGTGAVAFAAGVTVGGKTVDGRIDDKITAYDANLNQTKTLNRLTNSGTDAGLYLGQDGLLHMLPARVITGGADIASVFLPTSMTGGVPGDYEEYQVVNGIIYPIDDDEEEEEE